MKLIILNGPCGVGKSTIAAALHEKMPLSFLLDVDAQSRNISHYKEYREERWEIRDAISEAIIETCLRLGRDVIVDKIIFDSTILDSYCVIAKKYNADVHEIILWATKDVVMKRAKDRGWREESLLTPERCEQFWHEIDAFKEKRPRATVIDVSDLGEAAVLKKVQAVMI